MSPADPRISASFEVAGDDCDELVAEAVRIARGLMGERSFWLLLDDVHPIGENVEGDVIGWRGTARVAAPHDPAF